MILTPKQQWLVAGLIMFFVSGNPLIMGLALLLGGTSNDSAH